MSDFIQRVFTRTLRVISWHNKLKKAKGRRYHRLDRQDYGRVHKYSKRQEDTEENGRSFGGLKNFSNEDGKMTTTRTTKQHNLQVYSNYGMQIQIKVLKISLMSSGCGSCQSDQFCSIFSSEKPRCSNFLKSSTNSAMLSLATQHFL